VRLRWGTLRLATWLLRRQRRQLERHTVGRYDRRASSELDKIIAALEALA
jgi:hypothetical protein